MAPVRTVNDQNRKPSPYRLPLLLAVAGVLLLVLGFLLPVHGWNMLLIALGLILLLAVYLSMQLWFKGAGIAGLFAEKERDTEDNSPHLPLPPPLI